MNYNGFSYLGVASRMHCDVTMRLLGDDCEQSIVNWSYFGVRHDRHDVPRCVDSEGRRFFGGAISNIWRAWGTKRDYSMPCAPEPPVDMAVDVGVGAADHRAIQGCKGLAEPCAVM